MTGDWKEKLYGHCECFTGGNNKFQLNTDAPCLNDDLCKAYRLRFMLMDTEVPSHFEFIACLLHMNLFTRREILLAVQEMFKNSFDSAENSYTVTINKLKREGYQITREQQKDGIVGAKKEANN